MTRATPWNTVCFLHAGLYINKQWSDCCVLNLILYKCCELGSFEFFTHLLLSEQNSFLIIDLLKQVTSLAVVHYYIQAAALCKEAKSGQWVRVGQSDWCRRGMGKRWTERFVAQLKYRLDICRYIHQLMINCLVKTTNISLSSSVP